jgi:hypothetical protein
VEEGKREREREREGGGERERERERESSSACVPAIVAVFIVPGLMVVWARRLETLMTTLHTAYFWESKHIGFRAKAAASCPEFQGAGTGV